ncbi:MAG: hypothetical protein JW862_15660 [Anaerolineales bacterium]|nr:hypothetical protein [Anaerolineales bacterium]
MSESSQPDLASQFRELGDHLKNMLQSSWESEEAKKLRQELRHGLDELGKAATEAVDEFQVSEAGQKLKSEAEEFKARVESGEVEAKARQEISKVLATINAELDKLNQQWRKPEEPVHSKDEQV